MFTICMYYKYGKYGNTINMRNCKPVLCQDLMYSKLC